ncbi:aldo/keto reductase [Actinomadura madurae]|uniref:aldo/keto reductase n=1 Tax=Actinomadura madurae TaxID=1993 RepID=UPI003FD7AA66
MSDPRKIGDLDVFPLALGGNVFGWTADRAASFEILDAYAAGGGNFVDTADSYMASAPGNSGGESETIIGEWAASRGNRDDLVIATKVGRHPARPGLSAPNIRAAADDSLRRLRTDRIDLYFTHFDDPSVPVEEIMTALDGLVTAGKVRHIAVSNIEPDRLAASLEFSEREGTARYVAIQPHYNLVSRDTYEGPRRDLAERYGLAAVPYYGLASGFLTGKYRPGTTVRSARAGPRRQAPGHRARAQGPGRARPRRRGAGHRRRDRGARVARRPADRRSAHRERADPRPAPAAHRGRPDDPDPRPAGPPHRGVRIA